MNRVVYRTTLDVLKGGVQKTLQGFHVGDNLGRLIVLTLTSGADTFELPENGITAIMYVIQEDGTQSINHCEIIDNVISYEVLPSDVPTEGIVKLQLKIIANNAHGIERVLFAPVFAIEVEDSIGSDEIGDNPTFTALENALAKAEAAFSQSATKIEFTEDHIFRVTYADGSVYETDELKDAWETCVDSADSALDSKNKAYDYMVAAGDSEAIARTEANTAVGASNRTQSFYEEVMKRTIYTTFFLNYDDGHLYYDSANYTFNVNPVTGQLEWNVIE